MRKFLSMILSICFVVICMCGFVACDNIDGVNGDKGNIPPDDVDSVIYYAYDPETDEYEDANYITLWRGGAATWHSVDVSLGDKVFTGSVHFVNDGFAITLNGEFSAVDTCVMTYRGEKESDGVLRVDSTVITKYSQLVPEPNVTTDTNVRYFCQKDSKPENPVQPIEPIEPDEKIDGTYYEYDPKSDEYIDDSCLVIDGGSCNIMMKIDGEALTLTGTCAYTNGEFVMDCSGELMGVVNMRVVNNGSVEKSGVLHVTHTEIYTKGMDDIITDTSDYFCRKGVKPDAPVPPPSRTITLDPNGGAFASGTKTKLTTDENGRIVLPSKQPTRVGYFFNGYNTKKDGKGLAVEKDTVFINDVTVYAVWAKEVTVTFMDGITVIDTKKVGDGMPLGDFEILYDEYRETLFKGWYNGDKQYVSFTAVNGNTTLKAEWYTQEEIKEYCRDLDFYNLDRNCVYIHYRRRDHLVHDPWEREVDYEYKTPIKSEVYGDWPIWAWPEGGEGRFFHADRIDMFGAVYVIDCTRTFYDCGWDGENHVSLDKISKYQFNAIGIKIVDYTSVFKGGFWKSDGGDIRLNFEQMHVSNQVFIMEGKTRSLSYYY